MMSLAYQIILGSLPILFFMVVGVFIYRYLKKEDKILNRRKSSSVSRKQSVSSTAPGSQIEVV
jgi:hypothetical protein